jgi:hypothetical protein
MLPVSYPEMEKGGGMAKSTKTDQKTGVYIFADRREHNRSEPSHEDIERRAYEIYVVRGGVDGHAIDDWLQAERELLGRNR